MPMILLVLDHIQINVLNIHNPQGSAGHQIMKSPGSSFSCLWNIYDQGWVELVQMFWVWGLLSIQREFERERSPHPGKWNINLKQSHKHTFISMIKYERQSQNSSLVMISMTLRIIKIPSDPESAEQDRVVCHLSWSDHRVDTCLLNPNDVFWISESQDTISRPFWPIFRVKVPKSKWNGFEDT